MNREGKQAGVALVLAWLGRGQRRHIDDYDAPPIEAIAAAEREGLCFTHGTRVRLTSAGRHKVAPHEPALDTAGGQALAWPWRWGEGTDDRGRWVQVACGPSRCPDAYLDGEEGDFVLQPPWQKVVRLPVDVVVALLRRAGWHVQGPHRKHKRGKHRRSKLFPKSRSYSNRRRSQHEQAAKRWPYA